MRLLLQPDWLVDGTGSDAREREAIVVNDGVIEAVGPVRDLENLPGLTTMMFTIKRDGSIENIQREKSSGFDALDNEAGRALRIVRLPPLPRAYPNPTLTVHLEFEYRR